MNILILTPIHPLQITEMSQHLFPRYQSKSCEVFSPQAMALLYEETFKKPYPVVNAYFTETARDKKFYYRNGKKHLIVFGNIDQRSGVKFDRIIAYTSAYAPKTGSVDMDGAVAEENWDPYLSHSLRVLAETEAPKAQYYSHEDAEYTFPTLRHLDIFLKTLGIKQIETEEGDNRGTIQPSTTEGN